MIPQRQVGMSEEAMSFQFLPKSVMSILAVSFYKGHKVLGDGGVKVWRSEDDFLVGHWSSAGQSLPLKDAQ